ncbi:MAG: hypothetical protein AAF721_20695 [Myxococcota bacterium]
MPGPRALLWSAVLAASLASGCVRQAAPPQTVHTIDFPAPTAVAPAPVPPEILSAHFAIDNAPPLDGLDALPVVFSVELDAATVVPAYFLVARSDGSRARPKAAVLSPASESDENRTVLLVGEFGAPGKAAPTNVAVSGPVYSEEGQALRGLAAPVLAFETPPTIVFAESLAPAEGRCPEAKSVIRTYWSEGLRALAPEATAKLRVEIDGGQDVTPTGFDDHGAPGQDAGDDNVLDICVGHDARPLRLRVEAGVLADPAGHANEKLDVDVAVGRG